MILYLTSALMPPVMSQRVPGVVELKSIRSDYTNLVARSAEGRRYRGCACAARLTSGRAVGGVDRMVIRALRGVELPASPSLSLNRR